MYLLDLNLMFLLLLHWFSKDRKEKHGVHVLAQIYDFCRTRKAMLGGTKRA